MDMQPLNPVAELVDATEMRALSIRQPYAELILRGAIKPGDAPTGVIVGTATIAKCERENGHPRKYCWHLSGVKRLPKPRKPKGRPQPVWFTPF